LKTRVLNKIDNYKQPQTDEVTLVKNITCGEDHTLLLDVEGNVWSFGLNLNGQLGHGHVKTVERPAKINGFKNKISHIESEDNINFAVDEKGDSYMWPWTDKSGNINWHPLRLPFTEKISTVSCGHNFAIFLTSNGDVYSMGGTNKYGQLGHGDYNPVLRPRIIEFFTINNERINNISCGYKHCAARSLTGKVYTWGLGVKGQLGHGDFNNYTLPYQVRIETPFTKILEVSCGFRSIFYLSESRKLYFSGCTANIGMQNFPTLFTPGEKVLIFNIGCRDDE
jgi:alpha-tubulin suppressor-like RCC1 family protein